MASVGGFARARFASVLLVILAVGLSLFPPGAAAEPAKVPAPTVGSVTAKLDALARQTERLAEQYNKARIDVAAAERTAEKSRLAAAAAAAKYRLAHAQFVQVITVQYESGTPSATGALLTSNSGASYLDRLNTLNLLARHQADVVTQLVAAKATVTTAGKIADQVLRGANAKRRAVGEHRTQAAVQTRKFEALLRTLTAAQQRVYATRIASAAAKAAASKGAPPNAAPPNAAPPNAAPPNAAPPIASGRPRPSTIKTVHAGNAAAQRAVNFALAQVGKPYVFGAAGPGSYDCSGLTMAAWRAGGVSLPHLASSQYNYGRHVSANQLQPGDLVFFYHPIGHVSMYIGHNMLVSAPQPGENVKVLPLSYVLSDFVGATRLA